MSPTILQMLVRKKWQTDGDADVVDCENNGGDDAGVAATAIDNQKSWRSQIP